MKFLIKRLIKLLGGYTREEMNTAKTQQVATSSLLVLRKCQDIAILNRAKAKKHKQRATEHDKTVEAITGLLLEAEGNLPPRKIVGYEINPERKYV